MDLAFNSLMLGACQKLRERQVASGRPRRLVSQNLWAESSVEGAWTGHGVRGACRVRSNITIPAAGDPDPGGEPGGGSLKWTWDGGCLQDEIQSCTCCREPRPKLRARWREPGLDMGWGVPAG